MQREIRVAINRSFGTAGLLPGLPHSAIWQCDVLTTLLWIGILTAPPRYRGFDLSTFWAWLRYASAVSEIHSGLRLKPVWSDIDAHQKTVMSDDFGMGFSCHYLAEHHGLQAFANTSYLLESLVGVTSLRPSKRGPAKSPDFIAVDSLGRLHVLECKGTQSSVDYLISALASGIDQKNNFTNAAPFASSMVGGIFVPQHTSQEDAILMFIDPPPDPRLVELCKLPKATIEQGIYRISLSKELMAAGLWRTASTVQGRGRISDNIETGQDVLDAELQLAGFDREHHYWTRTLNYRSIETGPIHSAPQEPSIERSRRTSLNVEVPDEVVVFAREVLLMDRKGAQGEADQLIVDRAKTRRKRRSVRILSQRSDTTPFSLQYRRVESAWDQQSITATSSSLTGPSGIRFALSRSDGV